MEEIRIPLIKFDLSRFIDGIFNFMSRNEISPSTIACFSQEGAAEEVRVDEINQDSVREWLFQGRVLFLPFSDINTGDPIPCADGMRYALSVPGDLDEEVAVSIEIIETVGFLVRVEQDEVIICGAVFSGGEYYPIEGAAMDEDLKEFSEPMDNFVKRFMLN